MPSDSENFETVAMPATGGRASPAHTPPGKDRRFEPGTLLAGRYRIVSRLGKGGMGEVFRAEDIVLGQPVALKFLPEAAARSLNLLKRFYDEVRIARQVSHAHVCRVYDIGEIEGQPYLSMEYIDGEDLGSLLRRIGRLPADKALEFARKMCAGLAAAHAQGVLHRDLKPGNIMIDGRGQPRITDFGLAALAAEIEDSEIRNGTPAYMAPEQLEGREVSVQSDLYALGLVFYEMFTGKMPHQADTVAEILQLRKEPHITSPTTLVDGIDPAVERAILRCLDPEPKQRPVSALALSASLPGGDPLAAALAAGETPSPEIVAASGSTEAMAPKWALSALAVVVAALFTTMVVFPQMRFINYTPREYPPEVLVAKSRQVLRDLGYVATPADSAYGIGARASHLEHLRSNITRPEQWTEWLGASPTPVLFWYRESLGPMTALDIRSGGTISLNDPPSTVPGMRNISLDSNGRLLSMEAVPPAVTPGAAQTPDWSPAFRAASLDPAQMQPAEPAWTPPMSNDTRAAWTGVYPGPAKMNIRVEAAAFQGRVVYFEVLWPWEIQAQREDGAARRLPTWRNLLSLGFILMVIGLFLGACWFARYNWKAGRGDMRGAQRVGIAAAVLSLLLFVTRVHFNNNIEGFLNLLGGVAIPGALVAYVLFWVVYIALEPLVRRYWPQALVTWSRVLQGRWRDPLVGRDVLLATALGGVYALLIMVLIGIEMRLRGGEPLGDFNLSNLLGTRAIAGNIIFEIQDLIGAGLLYFMMMFVLRALLKKQWLAAVVFVLLWSAFQARQTDANLLLVAATYPLLFTVVVIVMLRLGLLAIMVMLFAAFLVLNNFATTDFAAWYGQSSWIVLAIIAAMAIWGFRTALGGRPLFAGWNPEK